MTCREQRCNQTAAHGPTGVTTTTSTWQSGAIAVPTLLTPAAIALLTPHKLIRSRTSLPKPFATIFCLPHPASRCRYQLRVCVEACRAHLLGLEAKGLAWGTALAMLRLPAGLRESDAFAAVTEVGWGQCVPTQRQNHCRMLGSAELACGCMHLTCAFAAVTEVGWRQRPSAVGMLGYAVAKARAKELGLI
jgi:hypothetical protein